MRAKKVAIGAITAALVAGSGVTGPVYAMEVKEQEMVNVNTDYQIVTPYWQNILGFTVGISANGTTLYPTVYIEAMKSSGKITGTMYVEKYYAGEWIRVNSWYISGTGYLLISKTHEGMSGSTYRTKVTVNIDGEAAEGVSGTIGI
ncbi:MAG TPA: hypothetical protein GXX75_05640 [Clostridiales bacterium]|nr:hypothetical protein [Clostridiales bacterium]